MNTLRSVRPSLIHFFHSVRFRLTLWFVAILALILVIFSGLIYTRQVRVLRSEVSNRLAVQSAQLSRSYKQLMEGEAGEHEGVPGSLQQDTLLLQPFDVLAVFSPKGTPLLATTSANSEDLANLLSRWKDYPPTVPFETKFLPANQTEITHPINYFFQLTPFSSDNQIIGYFLLGSPLDPSGQLNRLALTLAISSALILLAAFGIGYWLADRAMRPVQVITHTAREIGEGDLSRRINLTSEDELGELANTFDEMLTRLQAAFKRQRQFVADASHELRTPLTIIELETNRALEHPRSTSEYEQSLHVIQSENEWMTRLVNELLTLERVDAGQAALRTEPVDLSDIAVETIERLSALAERKGVQLTAGEMNEAPARGNAAYLSQMLTNLVENAIKYSQGPSPCVRLDTGSEARSGKPGGWVKVSDNGPGIPADHVPHLFDRFYRIDQARTREEDPESATSGSGLGLAIVHSIVQAYGGTIDVQSETSKGTTFTVWLPSPVS